MWPMVKWQVACCIALALLCPSLASAQPSPPTVSLVDAPFVRIGTVDGPEETVFAGIVAAVRLADGHIAVADAGNHVVRFFDASGRHLRSFGREGAGPGEFRLLAWIGQCRDAELLAVDAIQSRAAVISPATGTLLRSRTLPAWIRFSPYLSCTGDEVVLLLDRPEGPAPARGQTHRRPAAVVRASLETGNRDTLAALPGTDYYYSARLPNFSPLPLGARAMAAASGGWVYAAQNGEDRIHVIELRSGRRTTFRHQVVRPRVTAAAWESATSRFIEQLPDARTRERLTEVLAEAPIPETHPLIMDMKADRAGRLWLRPPSSASFVDWRVLLPDGRHVGSVRLAASLDPLDIGESHLVAVERDALGVQTIIVYSSPGRLFSFEN